MSWRERRVRVGPIGFLLRSPVRRVIAAIDSLYRDYPSDLANGIADFTVAVAPTSPARRFLRPKLRLQADVELPDMPPMPARLGPLALEMGMNLQLAAGLTRALLLHAGAVERDGEAVLVTGDSGAGKSTLTASLAYRGWRFLGDEFALVDPASGALLPFPRPISLKNGAIPLLAGIAPPDRFGPTFERTVKGTIRHLLPPPESIAAMDQPARPALIVEARFEAGVEPRAERLGKAEAFVLLSQASTNYGTLGEAGFRTLWRLVEEAPAYRLRYGSTADAERLLDGLRQASGSASSAPRPYSADASARPPAPPRRHRLAASP